MRFLLLLLLACLSSCMMQVRNASPPPPEKARISLKWPRWTSPPILGEPPSRKPGLPDSVPAGRGRVLSFGPRDDGTESFVVLGKRNGPDVPGIHPLPQCFLPTSVFAGPSPLQVHFNTLAGDRESWTYPASRYRSTFFELRPARTPKARGLLVYHTSIMLLSVAEARIVENFRKLGWHVMVALPPDSLFRIHLPTRHSPDGTLEKAARFLAAEMDRHYLEQAHSTHVALAYLAKSRPDWLTGRRVLMGTSAGTFAMPAEALMNPGWDALIFVSGGSNLLSLYESGAGGLFRDTLRWLDQIVRPSQPDDFAPFSNPEYHEIYRRAATLTRYHAGALAPHLKNHRILAINGSLDRLMPGAQSSELLQALGSPERWTFPLGHYLLALQLILETDRIDQWLRAKD